MTNPDPFWKLPSATSLSSQEQFYDHLKRSNHLRDTIYEPDVLDKRPDGRTRIQSTTFQRVGFSKTTMRNIIFRDCTFDSCHFIGSSLINCEFHNCRFISTNTHKLSISDSYIDPRSFSKCLTPNKHQNIGVHLYHELLHNSRRQDQIEFERDAHFYFLRWKRFQEIYEFTMLWKAAHTLREHCRALCKLFKCARRWIWEIFFGSGLRIRYLVGTVVLIEILFSLVNFAFRDSFGLTRDGNPLSTFWESFYFTTISLTTLGYGDVVPSTNAGLAWVAIQSVAGFFLLATLASMLFRKITP